MIELLRVIPSTIVLYIHAFLNIDILGVNLFFIFCSFLVLALAFIVIWRLKR